ncbi:hypothetical protein [Elizabethkingia ursingii]
MNKQLVFLAGIDAFNNWLKSLESGVKTGVLSVYNIVMYLLFGACVILIITFVVSSKSGKNVGFAAGEWAIISAIAAGAMAGAKVIFGI